MHYKKSSKIVDLQDGPQIRALNNAPKMYELDEITNLRWMNSFKELKSSWEKESKPATLNTYNILLQYNIAHTINTAFPAP